MSQLNLFTEMWPEKLIESTKGKFFTVEFIKRTDGELRRMNCRLSVKRYTRGGTLSYNPSKKGLIPVWERKSRKGNDPGYRMIPIEGIKTVVFKKRTYHF